MNKMPLGRLISGLFVLLCASGQAAEESTQGKTLIQAFETARSARLSVGIATAEIDAANARLAQANALRYPTLDLSSKMDWIDSQDTFSGITASVRIPELDIAQTVSVTQNVPRYQTSAGLTARYELYTGGRVQARVNQSELSLQAANLSRQLELQKVALDVSTAYFKLRRSCMQMSLASRHEQYARHVADVANQRLRDGRIASIEAQFAALSLAEKRSALRSQQEELASAYASYRESIQDAAPAEPETDERCHFTNSIEADQDQATQLSDQTLDMQHDKLKLDAAREGIKVQRAALRPQVSLYATYAGIGRSNDSFNSSFSDFGHRSAGVGVLVTFNLFDHGLATERVSEAEAEVRKQALQAEQTSAEREQLRRRREQEVLAAQIRIDLLRSRLDVAAAQADMLRQQLKAGTVKAGDADERLEQERDARDELNLAQVDLVLAKLAAMFSARHDAVITRDSGLSRP